MPLEHLRLEDLSDREFLLVVNDAADVDGYADSLEIATRLGIEGDNPRRTVASRLSWLTRWGAVQREHERDEAGNIRYKRDGQARYTQRWGLTQIGWQIASGSMRKGVANALERAGDDQMLELTRWLSRRNMSSTAAKLVQREWQRESMLRRGR